MFWKVSTNLQGFFAVKITKAAVNLIVWTFYEESNAKILIWNNFLCSKIYDIKIVQWTEKNWPG